MNMMFALTIALVSVTVTTASQDSLSGVALVVCHNTFGPSRFLKLPFVPSGGTSKKPELEVLESFFPRSLSYKSTGYHDSSRWHSENLAKGVDLCHLNYGGGRQLAWHCLVCTDKAQVTELQPFKARRFKDKEQIATKLQALGLKADDSKQQTATKLRDPGLKADDSKRWSFPETEPKEWQKGFFKLVVEQEQRAERYEVIAEDLPFALDWDGALSPFLPNPSDALRVVIRVTGDPTSKEVKLGEDSPTQALVTSWIWNDLEQTLEGPSSYPPVKIVSAERDPSLFQPQHREAFALKITMTGTTGSEWEWTITLPKSDDLYVFIDKDVKDVLTHDYQRPTSFNVIGTLGLCSGQTPTFDFDPASKLSPVSAVIATRFQYIRTTRKLELFYEISSIEVVEVQAGTTKRHSHS